MHEDGEDIDDSDLPPELRMNEYDDEDDNEVHGFTNNHDVIDEVEDDIAVSHPHIKNVLKRRLEFLFSLFQLQVMEQGNVAYADEDEWDAEDLEDNEIKASDALLVVAMTEDEFSHLEVQLFSEEGNLFVHHDITLPDFPLSLAWMDCPPFQTSDGSQSSVGNYIAVGTFSPAIEIWNLDVLDPLEPTAILGGENPELNKKSKKNKNKVSAFLPGSHEAAVMGLSWNSTYRQALASGSADTTVKIWDVTTQACSHTFTHHTDKVQSVIWHPTEAWLLATGAFDKTIGLIDARTATTTSACSLTADIESLTWDPFNPFHLYCALEDGAIVCIDVRNCANNAGSTDKLKGKNKAINFTFQAHEQTTSGISFSSRIPGMMATASIDKTVKVWDVNAKSSEGNGPRCIAYKTMNVGKLFALQYSPDDPFLLATAGDTGMVAVWESDELATIEDYFKARVQPSRSTYSALRSTTTEANGAEISAQEAFKSTGAMEAVESAIAEKEDESWMEGGVAGASNNDTEGKKKKKKFMKDKKNKA